MKNKLLVNVFATAVALFALTSCEQKSNVMGVCSDLVKQSLHKSVRSLVEVEGQTLTISEFEFAGDVNDDRLIYREIAFGNGMYEPKTVDTLRYTYGEWSEKNTVYSLNVTPKNGEPFQLLYRGNSLITPDGRVIGGEATDNMARVDKWEKTLLAIQNTEWEGLYESDYVLDSVFRDSVRVSFIPPMTFIYDTIQVFDRLDTVSADTTCLYLLSFYRDPVTMENTGHYYRKEVRSKYDKKTRVCDTLSVTIKEFDCEWFFSSVNSDAKFNITFVPTTSATDVEVLGISKFKMGDPAKPDEFLYKGATFHRLIPLPL